MSPLRLTELADKKNMFPELLKGRLTRFLSYTAAVKAKVIHKNSKKRRLNKDLIRFQLTNKQTSKQLVKINKKNKNNGKEIVPVEHLC